MKKAVGCIVSVLCGLAAAQTAFYVDAQAGSDAAPGTADKPFATLFRAREAVRAVKKAGPFPEKGITVYLNGRFDEPYDRNAFVLDAQDGGQSAEAPVTWRAGRKGAVLTGALRLTAADFSPVADDAVSARLRPEVRSRVRVCDLAKRGIGVLKPLPRQFVQWTEMELFAGGRDQPLARWPNTGWIEIPRIVDRGVAPIDRAKGEWAFGVRGGTFGYDGDEPRRWNVAKGVYMKGFWCHDWASETLRVAHIDTEKREITTEGIHRYGLGNHAKWHRAKRRYFVYNLLEELDAPGEWYVDREARKLYYIPLDAAEGDIFLSLRKKPLVLLSQTAHVVLKDLVFMYAGAEAVRGERVRNVTLDRLDISYSSQRGASLSGASGCTVRDCHIRQIGGTGLSVHGGERKTLAPGNNRVTRCKIHHCARLTRISGPCLSFGGCGNRIDHNAFHDAPYVAVQYSGNNHVFEYNDVACAMMESGDGGGMYTGRDWGSQGNIVRWNYFHHFGAEGVAWRASQGIAAEYEPLKTTVMVMGLYLDDCDSGDTVYGNIFYKAGWAMFCGGGRDNKWRNNLCIDCTSAAQLDVRGLRRARPGEGTKDGWDLLKKIRDFDWQGPVWAAAYPRLVPVMAEDPKLPIGTEFSNNVSIGCREFFRMNGQAAEVLKTRLACSGNVHVGETTPREKALFPQQDAALRGKLRLVDEAALEKFAKDSPLMVQDSALFKALKPNFPRIPVEEIGIR